MKQAIIYLLLIVSVLITACDKSDDPILEENGLTRSINDLVPQSILVEIESLGMPIYKGDTPPNIENIFQVDSYILKNSNIDNDEIGKKYGEMRIQFSNQNNKNLEVDFQYAQGSKTGSGPGSFIVGKNNQFTVFAKVVNSENAILTRIISGTLTDNGISNCYVALFMIDNKGVEDLIENGEGRVLYDSDGISPVVTELELKSAQIEAVCSDVEK